jgi:hypothetical protein
MPKAYFDIEARDHDGSPLMILSIDEIEGAYDRLFADFQIPFIKPQPPRLYNPPPMKIAMMIHFATTVGPYAPEESRTSPAYTKFIQQLLREGMVERPTKRERRMYPGWAYKATEKGKAYVEALRHVQQPVRETRYRTEMR